MVYCNNCGYVGHLYRDCKFPVLSYGVIIFREDMNLQKILMIQRRHSICYIEFLRGKYEIRNTKYIQHLINGCSVDEKQSLVNNSFETLWDLLWNIGNTKKQLNERMIHEYNTSKSKFNILISSGKSNLKYIVEQSSTNYITPEWEIPKGRRIKNESNIVCAIREFEEETGILTNEYTLYSNINPFIEEYKSDNGVNYKHIYYVAKYIGDKSNQSIDNDIYEQVSEIGDIQWLTIDESINKIRPEKKTKIPLINQIHKFLINYSKDLILKE